MKETADYRLPIADRPIEPSAQHGPASQNPQSATGNRESAIGNQQSVELHVEQHVELHIEELVLHGFAPGDRYRISEAIEHELARLLIDRGVSPSLMQGNELDRLDVGSFNVAPNSNTRAIGRHVAQAIYGGLIQ